MKLEFLNVLKSGVVFYPCSGFDFEMINEMQELHPNTKNFIYCNSEMPDGFSEAPDMIETRINESRFTFKKTNEVEINSIKCIDKFYADFIKIYGDDFKNYVGEIKNLITHYALRHENLTFNLFYVSAESLTFFNWLTSLKIKYNKNSKNSLVIKAPHGAWVAENEFITLLYKQVEFFNSPVVYKVSNTFPYNLTEVHELNV